jgi:hypothetical protein
MSVMLACLIILSVLSLTPRGSQSGWIMRLNDRKGAKSMRLVLVLPRTLLLPRYTGTLAHDTCTYNGKGRALVLPTLRPMTW